MPFKHTRVIHPAFETHHRPVAEGGMTGTVTVTRGGGEGTWNPETMAYDYPERTTVYTGIVRVQRQAAAEKPVRVGERQVIVRTYLVAFPADVPELRINDEVTVAGVSDADLPGLKLYMHDVWYGSLLWERDTVCQNTPYTTR